MYSYAIYLTHIQVLNLVKGFTGRYIGMYISENTLFVCYFILSIIIGGVLTFIVEKPFLKLREKIVPSKPKKEKVTAIKAVPEAA
jgi:peptidoglycan/LPS O-acetylase OafA/YrhL